MKRVIHNSFRSLLVLASILIFGLFSASSQNNQDSTTYSDCTNYEDTIEICKNSSVDFKEFSHSNTLTPIEWNWFFEGADPGTSKEQNPKDIFYDTSGLFRVRCSTVFINRFMSFRTSGVSCMLVSVLDRTTFGDIPIKDTTVCFGETILLDGGNENLLNVNYLWTSSTKGALPSPFVETKSIKASSPGFYKVRVFTPCGMTEKEIEVKHKDCNTIYYIPNSFTPNGDGLNDVYRVNIGVYDKYELKVYNRWGELIFVSETPSDGWDGYYKNTPCPPGIYMTSILIDNSILTKIIHLLK